MSTHSYIPDPTIVQAFHTTHLTDETVIFVFIVAILLILLYVSRKFHLCIYHE